jgi:hypothetical protein
MAETLTSQTAAAIQEQVRGNPLDARQVHALVVRMFELAGCRIFSERHGSPRTPVDVADLIVWHDSLDVDRGAPIVVEVQARADVVGALIPRLRRTKQAVGVRTLLALTSAEQKVHVEPDVVGGWIVQVGLAQFVSLLVDNDLNGALIELIEGRVY